MKVTSSSVSNSLSPKTSGLSTGVMVLFSHTPCRSGCPSGVAGLIVGICRTAYLAGNYKSNKINELIFIIVVVRGLSSMLNSEVYLQLLTVISQVPGTAPEPRFRG